MKQLLLGLAILMSCDFASAQLSAQDWDNITRVNFDSLLIASELDLKVPDELTEIPVKENSLMGYHKAYKHEKSGLEIRIFIRQPNNELPEGMSADEESMAYFEQLVATISGLDSTNQPNIWKMNKAVGEKEANADWMASTSFDPADNDFFTNVILCNTVGIRRDGKAEVYVFFICTEMNKQPQYIGNFAHIVKFKPRN